MATTAKYFTYKSSLVPLRNVGIGVGALGAILLLRSLYMLIFVDHSMDAGVPIFAERFIFGSLLLGLVGYVYLANRDRMVTISQREIVCAAPGKSFTIPMTDLVCHLPKRGQKKNRVIMLSDGLNMFYVQETYFPEFNQLLDTVKAFDRARENQRKELTLD